MFKASSLQLHDARSLRHRRELYINMRTQPTSAVILFAAKSMKNFHDAIMLVISIKIDFHLLQFALTFLSKIYEYLLAVKRLAECIGEIHSQRADSFVKHTSVANWFPIGQ